MAREAMLIPTLITGVSIGDTDLPRYPRVYKNKKAELLSLFKLELTFVVRSGGHFALESAAFAEGLRIFEIHGRVAHGLPVSMDLPVNRGQYDVIVRKRSAGPESQHQNQRCDVSQSSQQEEFWGHHT
jgi:hypothetical protein